MVKQVLTKWRFISSLVSIVVAICGYSMGKSAVVYGDYLKAVCGMYIGVVVAVAGIASMAFPCENSEATSVTWYMHVSVALLGVVLAIAGRFTDMLPFVVWSLICSAMSFLTLRTWRPSEDM